MFLMVFFSLLYPGSLHRRWFWPQSKLEFSPLVTTREASFKLTKPVPLHRSLLITCHIKASGAPAWARTPLPRLAAHP